MKHAATGRTYFTCFHTEDEAEAHMLRKNRLARDDAMFCLIDGPADNYAVVDLRTAIELGGPYRWAT